MRRKLEGRKKRFIWTSRAKNRRLLPPSLHHHPNSKSCRRRPRIVACPARTKPPARHSTTPPRLLVAPAAMGKHGHGKSGNDVEACYPGGGGMHPYMIESPQLRWAFIRKVYVIVAMQLLVTVAVAAAVNLTDAVRAFFLSRTPAVLAAYVLILVAPLIAMVPMIYFRNKHPVNLVFLFIFTVCISLSVGLACLSAKGMVILEAAAITLVVVVGLTGYTFWAAKRGYDFEFLGPFLVAACLVLMLFMLVRILFPMGKTGTMVYGCVAALIFSAFIVYDTDSLIKRYTYDEYVAGAITLYLDIINVFMALLTVLEGAD